MVPAQEGRTVLEVVDLEARLARVWRTGDWSDQLAKGRGALRVVWNWLAVGAVAVLLAPLRVGGEVAVVGAVMAALKVWGVVGVVGLWVVVAEDLGAVRVVVAVRRAWVAPEVVGDSGWLGALVGLWVAVAAESVRTWGPLLLREGVAVSARMGRASCSSAGAHWLA